VSINCNAIPGELLEAELFGHVKGAYTGAIHNRVGRFEQANKGTLFLDEIGDMPFSLQAKLLRVLQEREIQRLGSSETVKVDVRVIAATNANLPKLVEQGKFRQDLFYRLHVAPISVPPLRERLEDIPLLVSHFIEKICRMEQIPTKTIPKQIVEWLQTLPWLGNVRELENTIESAIAVSGERTTLQMVDFPALLGRSTQPAHLFAMPEDGIDYNAVVARFERVLLGEALRISGGHKKQAAEFLRLKRSTFSNKLDVLGIGQSGDSDGEKEDTLEAVPMEV
jgi:transcriptional regulator with GAF, ATPase, and Fis domain